MHQSFEYIKPVVMDLIRCDRRKHAWEIIDFYFKEARTLEDYDVLGYLALKADKRETYLACAEATFSLAKTPEQLYKTRINLFKAYSAMNYPDKALFYIEQNLQIDPNEFEILCQKAANMSLCGDKELAEEMLLSLVEKHPEKKESIYYSFSGKYLREGKTAQGIKCFLETFKPNSDLFHGKLGMKKWDGIIRPGETLYVEGEGGIGDEIINIRFLNNLRRCGMRPILYSTWSKYREDTVSLFRRNGFEVITDTYSIDTRCRWIPLMSLPAYLSLEEKDLWDGPYLSPVKNDKNKIASNKFKIGIKCSGNPYFAQDEYRKIPLREMLSYLPLEDVDVFYIDKEVGHEGVIDLGDKIETWEDTLDYIDQMDCVVSSCTSLVHAAGAIGKETCVVVPISEYYIWTSTRRDTTTPWYGDNFHVFKQQKLRSWDEPLLEMQKTITNLIKIKKSKTNE